MTVTQGVFTVAPDFGSGAFDGGERWLAIGGAGLGGAVSSRAGTLTLTNVNFTNDTATGGSSGGVGAAAGQGKGGRLYVTDPATTLIDFGGNTWVGTTASDDAGAPGDDDHVFGSVAVPVEVRGIELD